MSVQLGGASETVPGAQSQELGLGLRALLCPSMGQAQLYGSVSNRNVIANVSSVLVSGCVSKSMCL